MSDRDKLGRRGEKLAARHLRRNGYRIVERNFRCPLGEIDIIALRTRRSAEFEPPEVNVTPAKRRRIRRLAQYYLAEKSINDFNVRCDVIAIVISDAGDTELEHFEDAF